MMNLLAATLSLGMLIGQSAYAELENGKAAPDFTLSDATGKTVHLADFKGKTVVLEWTNFECPFVRKHYDSKNMQNTQAAATKDGTVWLSIVSSKKGKQGYFEPKDLATHVKKEDSHATAVLIDADGKVGNLYGAKTTPHIFIINAKGNLAYQGAIDDTPSTDKEDVKKAKNYVTAALGDLKAGKPVTTAQTKSYGCSVKY